MKRTYVLPFGVAPIVPPSLEGVIEMGVKERDGLVRTIIVDRDVYAGVNVSAMFRDDGTSVIAALYPRPDGVILATLAVHNVKIGVWDVATGLPTSSGL